MGYSSYLTDRGMRKNYDAQIASFTLFDDFFMSIVLKNNKRLMTFILRIILDKPDLVVRRVTTQDTENNMFGRSARFDVLAEDSSGRLYHVEVENSDEGADEHRASYYSAMMVVKSTKRGGRKIEYPENHTIFLTRKDYFGEGEAVYHINRFYGRKKKLFRDDIHMVYVNGAYKNRKKKIGRMIHDFHCSDPAQMYNQVIAESVRSFKEDEGKKKIVCEQIRKIEEESRKEGRKEGRQEAARGMFGVGVSVEKIAEGLHETVDVIRKWVEPVV